MTRMANLYLIGTIHIDTKGPGRLEKFLNHVRPDTIGIELPEGAIPPNITPEQVKQRKTMVDSFAHSIELAMMFKTHPKIIQRIGEVIRAYGYEGATPIKYINNSQNDTRLLCLDYRTKSLEQEMQKRMKEMANVTEKITSFSPEKIAPLIEFAEKYEQFIDEMYTDITPISDLTRKFEIENGNGAEFLNNVTRDRDEYTAAKIREVLPTAKHTMVYIGGLDHLFGTYHNLYERLRDLNPVRLKLNEVDKY